VDLVGEDDADAACALALIGRADADLDRAAAIDDAVADGVVEHRPVIDAPALVGLDASERWLEIIGNVSLFLYGTTIHDTGAKDTIPSLLGE